MFRFMVELFGISNIESYGMGIAGIVVIFILFWYIIKHSKSGRVGEERQEERETVELEKDNNRKNLLRPIIVNATTSPNGKNNLIIRLTNVGFKDDGNYFFKIYNGNTEIGSTRLKVIDIKKNEKEMLKFSVN